LNFKVALLGLFFLDLFSLLFIGKTWLAFFLPLFFFLFILLSKSSWMSPFLLFLEHHILLTLFSAQSYLLYFIGLLSLLLVFTKFHSFFRRIPLFSYLTILSTLSFFFYLTNDFFFDLYISLGEIEKEYYLSFEVLILLTIMHIFLFLLLFFQGSVFFKKD
jgi:hypothetical protein